jgi:PAS domain-containing protein
MTNNLKIKEFKKISLHSHMLGIAVLWSLLIALSLGWNLKSERSVTLEGVRIEARTAFEKDVVYRRWNSKHGEIYAPIAEATPPNPYLDVPERDITTPLGNKLTQINPAYMIRQAHELAKKVSGVKGHITSLNPIRPANVPDNWEAIALKAFQTGVKEVSSVEEIEDENYMRLMRPLLIEKACLKCHAKQGYKLGDIRGGLSISIPLAPRMAIERSHILTLFAGHGLLWIAGLLGLGFGMHHLKQQVHERIEAEKTLLESEEKYRNLIERANDGVIIVQDEILKFVNNRMVDPAILTEKLNCCRWHNYKESQKYFSRSLFRNPA